MKTFQDFLNSCLLFEGLTKDQAYSKYSNLLSKKPHLTLKNAGTTKEPDWVVRTKNSIIKAAKERQRKIKELEASSIFINSTRRSNKKRKAINQKGFEGHHITPIEHSHKLMSSMTPDEWRERQRQDAKMGLYHGDHPRNLQAASGTMSKNQGGIPHRTGGIHELEGKVKDIISGPVSLRDLNAAYLKSKRQSERRNNRRKREKSIIMGKLQGAKTAKDVDKIINA